MRGDRRARHVEDIRRDLTLTMAYVLDTTTTNQYQELRCPGSRRITVQVSNATAAIGFGTGGGIGGGAAVYPPVDEPFLPTVGGLNRECDAIRVKSYVPGVPARIMIAAS